MQQSIQSYFSLYLEFHIREILILASYIKYLIKLFYSYIMFSRLDSTGKISSGNFHFSGVYFCEVFGDTNFKIFR